MLSKSSKTLGKSFCQDANLVSLSCHVSESEDGGSKMDSNEYKLSSNSYHKTQVLSSDSDFCYFYCFRLLFTESIIWEYKLIKELRHTGKRGQISLSFYLIPFFLALSPLEVLQVILTFLNTCSSHTASFFLLLVTIFDKNICGLLNVAFWLARNNYQLDIRARFQKKNQMSLAIMVLIYHKTNWREEWKGFSKPNISTKYS